MPSIDSDQYGTTKPVPAPVLGGALVGLYGSVEISSSQSASDTINFFTAPKGFTPVWGWLYGDDIDTGTETYDLNIGTASDDDAYGNLGVLTGDAVAGIKPETGISMPLGGTLLTTKPTELTADTDIIGTVVAAANAGGTGTVTLLMVGFYNDPRVI